MKKLLLLTFLLSLTLGLLKAQSIYELSFTFPQANNPIFYKALLIDYNSGKAKLRLRFTSPAGKDILADVDVTEEDPGNNASCFNSDRIYYKLQKASYIESPDPAVNLPGYICLKKDPASGLFEPFGVTNSSADCKADVTRFTKVGFIDKKNLTKEFMGIYFKTYDVFYKNFFGAKQKALTTSERNVKLFLLFVANVTDPKIGTADRKNMKDALTFFGKVKQSLGIDQFIYDTVTGANFNKQTVENKIKTFLTPGPNDIVVFYYSGHGFRKEKDSRPGPYMDMSVDYTDKNYMDKAIKLEDITEMIRKKGARLNLVVSDCCNKQVGETSSVDAPAISGKKGGLGDYWSDKNLRDLFLNINRTTIMFTAAEPFQVAISNPEFGGYFSNFFINAIDTHLSYVKNNVKWEDIIALTKQNTEYKANRTWCNQARTVKCNPQRPVEQFIRF